jgi:hypothetical protein
VPAGTALEKRAAHGSAGCSVSDNCCPITDVRRRARERRRRDREAKRAARSLQSLPGAPKVRTTEMEMDNDQLE